MTRPESTASSLYARFLGIFSVHRGEVARTVLSCVYLLLIVAAYLSLKSVRRALFIHEFGAKDLPWPTLGIAVLTGTFMASYIRLSRRVPTARLTVLSLVFFASNLVLFWWLTDRDATWLSAVIYIWAGMFGVIGTTQVWTLANEFFTVREAKRLFGILGAGGSFGAVLGGIVANRLAPVIGTEQLLLVIAAYLVAAAGVVVVLTRLRTAQAPAREHEPPPRNLRESVRTISQSSHLRLMAGLVFIAALATTTIEVQYSIVIEGYIEGKDSMTAFFAGVESATSLLGFLVQLVLTSRFLSYLGVGFSILLLPASLILGTSALVFSKSLWAAVLLKGSDSTLKHSLDRSCRELMYLPVPHEIKVQTKSTIDTVTDRLGDGTSGVFQLLILKVFGWGLNGLIGLSVAVVVVWIALAVRLKRRYVDQLRLALGRGLPDEPASEALALDADARRTFLRLLVDGTEREKLATLEWASGAGIRLDESTLRALARDDPSPEVRRSALASLLGLEDLDLPAGLLEELERQGQDVLVSAIDLVVEHDPARLHERLDALLGGSAEASRLPLVAFMLRRLGTEFEPFAARIFEALLEPEVPPDVRTASVRTLGLLPPGSAALARLPDLLSDPDPNVAAAAAEVAARHRRSDLLGGVTDLLGLPAARAAARAALESFGAEASAALEEALRDRARTVAVRRQVPARLARVGTARGVGALVDGLGDPDPVVRRRSLDALLDLERRHPEMQPLRGAALAREAIAIAGRCGELTRAREGLRGSRSPGPADRWLVEAIDEELHARIASLFGVLSLEYPPSDMRRASIAFGDGDYRDRANALELLTNLLPRPLERRIVPMLEEDPDGRPGHDLRKQGIPTRLEALRELALGDSPWLAACALYAARRSSDREVEDAARRLAEETDPVVREEATAFLAFVAGGAP